MSENQIPNLKNLKRAGAKKASEKKVRARFLDYFKKNKSNLSFSQKLETLYDWFTSGTLSTRDKAIVIGALLYFINPLDVIPDITPFFGFTDDLGVVYLVYNYLQNRAVEESAPTENEGD